MNSEIKPLPEVVKAPHLVFFATKDALAVNRAKLGGKYYADPYRAIATCVAEELTKQGHVTSYNIDEYINNGAQLEVSEEAEGFPVMLYICKMAEVSDGTFNEELSTKRVLVVPDWKEFVLWK